MPHNPFDITRLDLPKGFRMPSCRDGHTEHIFPMDHFREHPPEVCLRCGYEIPPEVAEIIARHRAAREAWDRPTGTKQ